MEAIVPVVYGAQRAADSPVRGEVFSKWPGSALLSDRAAAVPKQVETPRRRCPRSAPTLELAVALLPGRRTIGVIDDLGLACLSET